MPPAGRFFEPDEVGVSNKRDDEIGFFGMARWDVGEGRSETLYIVTPLPARYGDVLAFAKRATGKSSKTIRRAIIGLASRGSRAQRSNDTSKTIMRIRRVRGNEDTGEVQFQRPGFRTGVRHARPDSIRLTASEAI